LNLKSIEVTQLTKSQPDTQNSKNVEFKLLAEGSMGEVMIRGKLKKAKIDSRPLEVTPLGRKAKRHQSKETIPDQKTYVATKERPSAVVPRTLPNQTMQRTPFDVLHRMSVGGKPQTLNPANLANLGADANAGKMIMPDKPAESLFEMPTVRMSVPTTIGKSLRPGGQSVMIKIEPDHLGPARLNLSVRNDVLTARVTVDTPMARMAVESSLEQLSSQLARAGIEVSLNGDQPHHQFFGRRPAWSQSQRTNQQLEDDDLQPETIENIPVMPSLQQEYLNSDGVNLLA